MWGGIYRNSPCVDGRRRRSRSDARWDRSFDVERASADASHAALSDRLLVARPLAECKSLRGESKPRKENLKVRNSLSLRLTCLLVFVTVAAIAAGCGSSPLSSSGDDEPRETFTMDNVQMLFGRPEGEIKGSAVKDLVGQVTQVERDADGTAVVVSTDPESFEGRVVVLGVDDSINEDDYLRFSGEVFDVLETENAMGAELKLPRINSTEVTKVDAMALDPALRTIKVNQTKDLNGVAITVRRVEIAEKQTRIWVKYKNNSSEEFYPDVSLTAGGSQVEEAYTDEVKAPASSVNTGARTSGILTFEPVKQNSRLKLRYDGHNSNYDEIRVVFSFGGKG